MFEELYDAISFAGHPGDGQQPTARLRMQSSRGLAAHCAPAFVSLLHTSSRWVPMDHTPGKASGRLPGHRLSAWHPRDENSARVRVRFRPDKPAVSRLDRGAWKGL